MSIPSDVPPFVSSNSSPIPNDESKEDIINVIRISYARNKVNRVASGLKMVPGAVLVKFKDGAVIDRSPKTPKSKTPSPKPTTPTPTENATASAPNTYEPYKPAFPQTIEEEEFDV